MTPVRTPAIVRGDVPGLLRRGMPVTFIGEGLDGEPVECVGVVLDDAEPNTTWRVANLTDGVPADLYGDETRAMQPLWTDPAALYLSLHWLADRGHPCLWMLPATHGGRVTEWDGLTAWEVSAIVVSVSVGRVARGVGPIVDIGGPWARFFTVAWIRHGICGLHGRAFVHDTPYDGVGWGRGSSDTYDDESGELAFYEVGGLETGDAGKLAADTAALADGCCLLVPGGLVVPV